MFALGTHVSLDQRIPRTGHVITGLVITARLKDKPTGWKGRVIVRKDGDCTDHIYEWQALDDANGDREIISRGAQDSAEAHKQSHYTFPFSSNHAVNEGIKKAIFDWLYDYEGDIRESVPSPPVMIRQQVSKPPFKKQKPLMHPIPQRLQAKPEGSYASRVAGIRVRPEIVRKFLVKQYPEKPKKMLPEPVKKPDAEVAKQPILAAHLPTLRSDSATVARRLLELINTSMMDVMMIENVTEDDLRILIALVAKNTQERGDFLMRLKAMPKEWQPFRRRVRKIVWAMYAHGLEE